MIKYRLYGEDEASKNRALATAKEVLLASMKMMAPFIPFVTEELYRSLFDKDTSIHNTL